MTNTPKTPADALEAAVDHWQAWLDDLPLPECFSTGATELQEFLRALSARIAEPPSWEDRDDDLTHAINKAHPVYSKAYDAYARAMELVGNRHSKGAIVRLVCYLLQQVKPAAQAVAAPVAVVQPDRATFDAMCAMRDAINEYVPMPSLESDLIQGPENSVFCATVAEAVIAEIVRLRSIQPAAPVAEAVAGAYLAALKGADTFLQNWVDRDWSEEMERAALNTASGISDRILALTPADAAAALARRDAEVRKAALREALREIADVRAEEQGLRSSCELGTPDWRAHNFASGALWYAHSRVNTLIEEPAHG